MLKDNTPVIHEGILSGYAESDLVIFGIPFDGTVSFKPGTRFGPQAVRQELDGLETYSPYLDRDLADYKLCDLGDISLPLGNTGKVMDLIECEAQSCVADGKKTLAVGGEHLVSYPLIKAYLEKYPDLHIVHLDAHADLRDDYLGEKLSHATVMRRVFDDLGTGKIWQFGIRSGTKEEFAFAAENTVMQKFDLGCIDEVIGVIGDQPVYLSIDLDVLDPSIFSGTGTPEPGGVTFKELMVALQQMTGLNIVGGDMVELSPHYDQSGVSTAVACKVLREMVLIMVG
ncbi:MAG: agmatinase [Kiritimatiellae bacterium]|jgi:agmatinase|nr:agmatinase [Kiritimatiellia bacterium]